MSTSHLSTVITASHLKASRSSTIAQNGHLILLSFSHVDHRHLVCFSAFLEKVVKEMVIRWWPSFLLFLFSPPLPSSLPISFFPPSLSFLLFSLPSSARLSSLALCYPSSIFISFLPPSILSLISFLSFISLLPPILSLFPCTPLPLPLCLPSSISSHFSPSPLGHFSHTPLNFQLSPNDLLHCLLSSLCTSFPSDFPLLSLITKQHSHSPFIIPLSTLFATYFTFSSTTP